MSKKVNSAQLYQLYQMEFARSGLSYHEFRTVAHKNERIVHLMDRAVASHSRNPYPKALSLREKLDAHQNEAIYHLSRRLAENLEGMSTARAQQTMRPAYIASVLDVQLHSLPSGANPDDFFAKAGVPDPANAYGTFKEGLVKAAWKTWDNYLQKPYIKGFDSGHMREYFVKYMPSNL